MLSDADLPNATPTVTINGVAVDDDASFQAAAVPGATISVNVALPYSSVSWLPGGGALFLSANQSITAAAAMTREGWMGSVPNRSLGTRGRVSDGDYRHLRVERVCIMLVLSFGRRRGGVTIWIVLLILPLFALTAFAVDLNYVWTVDAELQNAADAACAGRRRPAAGAEHRGLSAEHLAVAMGQSGAAGRAGRRERRPGPPPPRPPPGPPSC